MYNDFVIVGPPSDPAGIKGMKQATEALKTISEKGVTFISRGDRSGTHVAEMELWEKAGIKPSGSWYVIYEKGSEGNVPTLRYTDQKEAYTVIDRATFLPSKIEIKLVVLVEKDEALLNYISLIPVNPQKFPKVNYEDAMVFVRWLTSPEKGQKIIRDFGKDKYGSPLFFPNSKEWKASQGQKKLNLILDKGGNDHETENDDIMDRIMLGDLHCSYLFSGMTPVHAQQKTIILATTTSTQDSGLLDVLLPIFEKKTGYFVKTIAVGSGQAMAMGQKGEADVLLVHSPDAEKKFMAEGYGINRRLVMHNDFIVVGPSEDPAKIKGLKSSLEAFKRSLQPRLSLCREEIIQGPMQKKRRSGRRPGSSLKERNGTSRQASEWARP